MASAPRPFPELEAAVEAAAREMLRVKHWGDATFVSLPLFYPSGTPVTVRIATGGVGGAFRVDDGGFAYRELESVGFERSFAASADKILATDGLSRDKRKFIVDAHAEELARAISDIGLASWNVTDRVYGKLADQEEQDIEDHLRERLASVFGASHLEDRHTIAGASSNPWEVSAIIQLGSDEVVFQAVGNHANSVYRTSTAFHDLASLPKPPRLVSVVRDKQMLGHKLSILSQAGRVIQSDQSDETYLRAAA